MLQLPVEALAKNDSQTVLTFSTQLHNFLFGTFLQDELTIIEDEIERNWDNYNSSTFEPLEHSNETLETLEEEDFSSRQMIVCGESGREVMLRSVGEERGNSSIPPAASVRVVRRGGLRLTVVLDRSQSEERYRVSRQALYNLVSQLPRGTMLALIIYTNTARIALHHTRVTEDNMEGLFGRIPGRNVRESKPCLDCALRLALTLNSSKVLVMSGKLSDFSVSKEVAAMTEKRHMRVHLMAGDVAPSAEMEKLLLKGGLHLTQSLTQGKLLSEMRRVLQDVIGGGRQTIYREEHRFTGESAWRAGLITISLPSLFFVFLSSASSLFLSPGLFSPLPC